MKKNIIVIILSVILLYSNTAAEGGNLGLGIIIGEPTGFSAKLWATDNTAFDGAVAWSLIGNPGERNFNTVLHVHADYLLHNFSLLEVEAGQLPFYYGVGGRIKFQNKSRVGVRVPVGLAYIFEGKHVDLFLEIVPLFDIIPATEFGINSAIGVRYFF
ncbi:MAG: hypothetical protein KGZ86_01380 [Candidatus Latescibacteria bacterium]|nr:hypothetical protein [Candidatus Latescibacterota bacterium]